MPTIRVDDKKSYEVPSGTLGELREVKRIFGVVPRDFTDISDPDVVGGILFIAMKRAKVAPTDDEIVALIDAVEKVEFIEDEAKADPTPAAENAAAPDEPTSAKTDLNPETTPEPSGDPSTPASTE